MLKITIHKGHICVIINARSSFGEQIQFERRIDMKNYGFKQCARNEKDSVSEFAKSITLADTIDRIGELLGKFEKGLTLEDAYELRFYFDKLVRFNELIIVALEYDADKKVHDYRAKRDYEYHKECIRKYEQAQKDGEK